MSPFEGATSAFGKPQRAPTAHQRAVQRQVLLRALKRNPKVATKRWFLRKASLFGVDLPVTFRLNASTGQATTGAGDDAIRIDLTPTATAAPLPVGNTVASATSTLTGSINGAMRFSQDTAGYGGTGIVELSFSSMQVLGSGFDLITASDTTGCGADTTLLKSLDPIRIGQDLSTRSLGYVDLFQGKFSIDLRTVFSFASGVRSDCVLDGFGNQPPFTTTSFTPFAGNPPLPLRLDGAFRISPALTADGRMRFGKLEISGPQHDSFVQLHTCTQAPPPATSCATNTDGVLTGRLIATAFTAELLIGN